MLMQYDPLCCADSRSFSYAQGLTRNIWTVAEGYGIVTGWGRLTENGALPHILQMVSLPLIAWSQCHPMYQRLGYAQYLKQCQLCGGFQQGGSDSCQVNACSCPMKVTTFWHVTPCPLVVGYQRFGRAYCVHVAVSFRLGVNEIFPLRGCYTAICCPKMSLPNYSVWHARRAVVTFRVSWGWQIASGHIKTVRALEWSGFLLNLFTGPDC